MERAVEGDTTTVTTLDGSARGHPSTFVPEHRFVDGSAPTGVAGYILWMGAGPGGELFVIRRGAEGIAVFDEYGSRRGVIGAGGPGEPEATVSNPMTAVIHSDGTLSVHDLERDALVHLTTDGRELGALPYDPIAVEGVGMFRPLPRLFADRSGAVASVLSAPGPARPVDAGGDRAQQRLNGMTDRMRRAATPRQLLFRVAPDGGTDTVRLPPKWQDGVWWQEVNQVGRATLLWMPWTRAVHAAVTLDGGVLTTAPGDYPLDIVRPDGSVLRIDRAADDIPISEEERVSHRDRLLRIARMIDGEWDVSLEDFATSKPPIQGVQIGGDGRIWVERATTGVVGANPAYNPAAQTSPERIWVEAPAWDVFEPDGRFLGEVVVPFELFEADRPSRWYFRGDYAWAVVDSYTMRDLDPDPDLTVIDLLPDDLAPEAVRRYRIAPWPDGPGF